MDYINEYVFEYLFTCIDFGGEDEVVFGKSADGVSGKFQYNFVVIYMNVRMMTFGFGKFRDIVDEIYGTDEIFKLILLRNIFYIFREFPV